MIIDSTTIGMESARTFKSDSREARFTCITDSAGIMPDFTGMVLQKGGRAEWNAGGRTGTAGLNGPDAAGQTGSMQAPSPPGTVDEPRSASEMLRDIFDTMQVKNTPQMRRLMEENMLSKIQEETIKYLMRIIGGRISGCGPGDSGRSAADYPAATGLPGVSGIDLMPTGRYLTKGCYTVSYEAETTTFATTGTVNTADGRSLSINVEAVMSREYVAYSGFTVRESTALVDPLVINLDGSPATVSDQKYFFDIDADGTEDYVSLPSAGSGMLALDLNGDGRVNDGSELFGPTSGDAFSELAEYDLDGNGWIDEADAVFPALKIWRIDENDAESGSLSGAGGNVPGRLVSLKDAGIGAICLKHAATEFSLKDAVSNATDAVIRSTGLFLFEDGRAGTAQQLDLATA